ncbi:MAG: TonB-dependent receptor [Candidatus Aminicenantaceae bacterium]
MRLKCIITILLLPLVFFSLIYAQQYRHRERQGTGNVVSLEGVVKNIQESPVPDALVIIPELEISVRTNQSGRFKITNIQPGMIHIEVYKEGYVNYISDRFYLKNDKRDFYIILSNKLTEEVVVTATRTKRLYAEVPVKTEVITHKDIKSKQAQNLAESLSLTTGIRVENKCQNCNFTQVRLNGMEGKYSQVLINNSPIFSSMIGVYGLEQIPSEMLDRIEIVKGGGSALYGGNAVAGVINIITKEPQTNETYIKMHHESISGDPFSNIGFRSNLVSESGNTKAFLFANYKNREPVELNGDQFSELGSLDNTSFGLNFYNDFPGIKGKLKLGFFRILEERRGGDLFKKPPHEANIAEWAKSDLIDFSLDWDHYLGENMYYNISFSFMDAERETYYGSNQDPNAYGSTQNPILFLNSQANYQAGSHLLTLGAQFKGENLNDEALGYNRQIEEEYDELGLFFQDDFKLSKTFSILAGLRLSQHSLLDHWVFNPRMSVLVNLSEELGWRTTFSTGYRAPQIFDEDLHITQVGGEGMIIENAEDLKEESSYSLTTGIDYGKQYGQNLFQFSLEGFYTLLSDTFVLSKQEYDPRENALVFERINGSDSKTYGVSWDFSYKWRETFSFTLGWTLQKSRLQEPEPDFNTRHFFRTPGSYGYAKLNYANQNIICFEISAEYTGKMKVPHFAGYISEDTLETTDPFLVLDLKLHRPFYLTSNYKMIIFVGVYNLLDSYQKDLDRGINRDSGYVYGPAKPRSIYVGFEFSF